MGLAKCRMFAKDSLKDLQEKAQEAKLGYWGFTDVPKPEAKKTEQVEVAPAPVLKEEETVYVTHIQDGSTFYVRSHPCPRNADIEKALKGYPGAAPRMRPPYTPDMKTP